MKKHICKQCNKVYEYCRGCLLSPISYKENGYCSETCYEASKNKVESIVEEISTIEITEVIINNPSIEDVIPTEEKISVETEIPTLVEDTAETTTVVEPTIKNETNTYKKKKNKYRVHE